MGRVGPARTTICGQQHENIVGIDSDPGKIESNIERAGASRTPTPRIRASGTCSTSSGLRAIMLALPDLEAKVTAARALRMRGFKGLLSATHLTRGVRADHRGGLRRELQLLHRGRRRALRAIPMRRCGVAGSAKRRRRRLK